MTVPAVPAVPAVRSPARTARAALFAAVAVLLVDTLRARSDGPPPSTALLLATVAVVALLVRPLTGRERRLPVLVGSLIAVQLVLRAAFLLASTGQLAHSGPTGLFCSPAASGIAATGCLPTERGGFVLLAVQLGAAVVLAAVLRDTESASWGLARHAARSCAEAVAGVVDRLAALASSIAAAIALGVARSVPAGISGASRPASDASLLQRLVVVRSRRRRGPPAPGRIHERPGRLARAVPCGAAAPSPIAWALMTA